jgi:hypothetical protein
VLAIEPGRISFEPDRVVTSAFGGSSVEQRGTHAVIACTRLLPPPWRRWLVITDGVHTVNVSLTGRGREIETALRNAGFDIESHTSWISIGRDVAPHPRRTVPSLPEWLDRLTGFSKSSGGLVLAMLSGLLLTAAGLLLVRTIPSEHPISAAATIGSFMVGVVLAVPMGLGSRRANTLAQCMGLLAGLSVFVAVIGSPEAGWTTFSVLVIVVWTASGISIVIYAVRKLQRRRSTR